MKKFLAIALVVCSLVGCHRADRIDFSETTLAQKGAYETVWVNPTVVYSDSLCTLVSAERLDSVFVRSSERSIGSRMTTITFELTQTVCPVTAIITDRAGLLVLSLFRKQLIRADYKLTLDPTYLQELARTQPTGIEVRLTICGVTTRYPLDLTAQ